MTSNELRETVFVYRLGPGFVAVFKDFRTRGGLWVLDRDPERAVWRLLTGRYGLWKVPEFAD